MTRTRKSAGALVGTSRSKITRTQKIAKKFSGIKPGVGSNSSKEIHTINIFAKHTPVELQGFLVSMDEHNVVFRHKRTSGSRKIRKSVFPSSQVVEVFGSVGEFSSILMFGTKLVNTLKGYVARSKTSGIIKVKNATTGEISTIHPHPDVTVEVFVDEEDGSTSGRGKAKKKALASDDKPKRKRVRSSENPTKKRRRA